MKEHTLAGLPQEGLKAIACITMCLDHMAVILFPHRLWMRAIGRIAFPIYCFLLVEGFYHTSNRQRYGVRLAFFALISEFAYDFAFYGQVYWGNQNVMVTLLFGFFALLIFKGQGDPWRRCLGLFTCYLIPTLMKTDYGGEGVLMVLLFAMSRETANQVMTEILGLVIISLLVGGSPISLFGLSLPFEIIALLSLLPIHLYSGEKCSRSRILKWGFYWFYPIHLFVLKIVQIFMSHR